MLGDCTDAVAEQSAVYRLGEQRRNGSEGRNPGFSPGYVRLRCLSEPQGDKSPSMQDAVTSIMDRVAQNNGCFFLTVLEAGRPRSGCQRGQVRGEDLLGCRLPTFVVSPRGGERAGGPSDVSFVRVLRSHSRRLHPQGPVTSQRSHLLLQSPWGWGVRIWRVGKLLLAGVLRGKLGM